MQMLKDDETFSTSHKFSSMVKAWLTHWKKGSILQIIPHQWSPYHLFLMHDPGQKPKGVSKGTAPKHSVEDLTNNKVF